MKKITLSLLMASMLLGTIPASVMAQTTNNTTATTNAETDKIERSNSMLLRLDEINTMDKTNLSATEKRALKKEVRSIKKEANGGGIYISAGAIIIILLLIIIL